MNTLPIPLLRRKNAKCGLPQRGISLIETMVGLTLGMLVTVVILQVWGGFEDQKSRTVSGSSAQESGLLAITQIEQDVRNAGSGFTDSAAFDCSTIYSYYENAGSYVSPAPAYSGGTLAPVKIADGGTGSDTIAAMRGTEFLGSIPATITATMPSSSSELNLSRTYGFCDGLNSPDASCTQADIVLVVQGGNCTVMEITHVQNAALKLQHNPGGTTTYNPPVNFQNTNAWPAYTSGAKVMKVGQMQLHEFTVNASNQLILRDLSVPNATTTSILASDVVKLKAQYGIADAGTQNVNDWVSATGGWATLDTTESKRIKAIRVVIVARSSKMESSDVTGVCTNTSGVVNNGPCAWPDTAADPAPQIDLSADPNWRRYRYRVYQTIIPIRNVIWAGV